MTFRPPRPQNLTIAGPSGVLEALLEDPGLEPGLAAPAGFGVVCHPHPLHGGTLDNKVVHTVARAFQQLGLPTVRFNFRGVGASAGRYDDGRGEIDDAMAVIEWGRARWPGAVPSLGGFSFGALVAIAVAEHVTATRLVCVAPPVQRLGPEHTRWPRCPWLIVQGDADEVVDPRQVQAFATRPTPAPELVLLSGVGHFFHGRLHELQDTVLQFCKKQNPADTSPPGFSNR